MSVVSSRIRSASMTWAAISTNGWLIAGMTTIKARLRMVRHGWKTTACRASSAPDRGKTIRATFEPPTVITTMRPCAIRRTAYVLHIRNKREEIDEGDAGNPGRRLADRAAGRRALSRNARAPGRISLHHLAA